MSRAEEGIPSKKHNAPNFCILDKEEKKTLYDERPQFGVTDTFGDVNPILSTGDWDMEEMRALERRHNSILAKFIRFFYP